MISLLICEKGESGSRFYSFFSDPKGHPRAPARRRQKSFSKAHLRTPSIRPGYQDVNSARRTSQSPRRKRDGRTTGAPAPCGARVSQCGQSPIETTTLPPPRAKAGEIPFPAAKVFPLPEIATLESMLGRALVRFIKPVPLPKVMSEKRPALTLEIASASEPAPEVAVVVTV